MHSFHLPDLSAAVVELPDEESGHALRVLRLTEGERILLVDGKGTTAVGLLRVVAKHSAHAAIIERTVHPAERTAKIHLAVAPTKQIDRYEWMLEKCTEIGVDRITPLMTSRTERAHLRTHRLRKILVGAMKQSQRAWLPQLDEPITIDDFLDQPLPDQRFFGWCEGEHVLLTSAYRANADALLLIGPEGDFTPIEADHLRARGCTAMSLGAARLRTETAAVVGCTWMSYAQVR